MNWDNVYGQIHGGRWEPSEGMVKLISRYCQRRIGVSEYHVKKKIANALDIGCGNGNHVLFLEKQGINCTGIDISDNAISNARLRLEKEGISHADLAVLDAKKMQFDCNSFDLIISDGVCDHVLFDEAKMIIDKAYNCLSQNGYLFISLRSIFDSEFGRGEFVEKNTYRLVGGYENGEIQHFFDISEISQLLHKFNIFDLELSETIYPSEYSLDKAYIQSSGGVKRYLNNLEEIWGNSLKNSRWIIAAEKR